MGLGTIAFKGKIYNLDFMSTEETQVLLKRVEENKKALFKEMKAFTAENEKK